MIYIQSIFLLLFLIYAQGEAAIIQHQQYEALNYYDILGVSCDASFQAIRDAYKKSALRWHPDKNKGNEEEAEIYFKLIGEAYETLSDVEKRANYDLDQEMICEEYCFRGIKYLYFCSIHVLNKYIFQSD